MTRRLLLLVLGVTLAVPAHAQRTPRAGAVPAPNIVIFLAEDLGIGETGPWGQKELLW